MTRYKQLVVLALLAALVTGCHGAMIEFKQTVGLLPQPHESWQMMLSEDADEVREGILAIIERRDSDPELVGKFAERLTYLLRNDRSQLVRSASAIALSVLGEKTLSVPALLEALGNPDNRPVVLADSVRALAVLGSADPRTAPALRALFDSATDESVRAASVGALGTSGEEGDLPLLLAAVRDDNSQVRYAAAKSLRTITGLAFEADSDLWEAWYNETNRADYVATWQAEQDRIATERGGQKGGFIDSTLESMGKVGVGITEEVSLGVHELVLIYKRTKRSLFGHAGQTPPDRSERPEIDTEAPLLAPKPETNPVVPNVEPKPITKPEAVETAQADGTALWEYPVIAAVGVYDGAVWLGDKVVTYPIEAVKWLGDAIVFWDDE